MLTAIVKDATKDIEPVIIWILRLDVLFKLSSSVMLGNSSIIYGSDTNEEFHPLSYELGEVKKE